jgi:phosphopantothenoylcysteine decarboxylase/phosphopantothenate--cysteine ligase
MKLESSLRFLVTAGPTREFLDPIRYISNRSSGKMGYALAAEAAEVASHVTLVSGPVALTPPAGVEIIRVISAQEMADAVLSRYDLVDVVIMAAAVCDFRPAQSSPVKIKKQSLAGALLLEPTVDILAEMGRRKGRHVLVGFAAETDQREKFAKEKLVRKNADMIVANDASALDSDENSVTMYCADGRVLATGRAGKQIIARQIIKQTLQLARA